MQIDNAKASIVDDNATNRHILEEILRNWGMRTASASSADEALTLLAEAATRNEPFQIVLSDVNMPDVDGFALVERCRNDQLLRDSVFIMLTSATRSGDTARCKELGIRAHLVKPVKQSELYDSIAESLGVTVPTLGSLCRTSPRSRPSRRLRILLAEDSLANQKLAIGLLSKWGHQVTLATNGREAVATATSPDRFDLIFMDVQMPEMDGFEATHRIRESEAANGRPRMPIVAMTAHAMKGDRERCFEAGMDGYISKPIRPPSCRESWPSSPPESARPPLQQNPPSPPSTRLSIRASMSRPERGRRSTWTGRSPYKTSAATTTCCVPWPSPLSTNGRRLLISSAHQSPATTRPPSAASRTPSKAPFAPWVPRKPLPWPTASNQRHNRRTGQFPLPELFEAIESVSVELTTFVGKPQSV